MNLHFWAKRLLGKPTCDLETGVRLTSSARIRNAFGKNSAIRVGRRSIIKGELLTFRHGGTIIIGDHCFVGEGTRVWSSCSITIGARTLVSHNVNIIDSLTHPMNPRLRHEQFLSIASGEFPEKDDLGEKPIRIDEDVLIGCQSVILRGVSIGRGSVVGAGSVVSRSVPEWTLVAGNPAKIIRELTEEERGPFFTTSVGAGQ
jgi:acetyltransferase-like isoleucine patch superfamily enzyme